MHWEWLSFFQDCTIYRYWDDSSNQVNFCYYGSSFLGHGTHQDLLKYFISISEEFNKWHLCQLSMHCPKVNLGFFEGFSHQFKEVNFYSLKDIGSCILHIVHDNFSRRELELRWSLKKFLKGAYHLLFNPPARMEDYETVTSAFAYPLSFYST